MKRLEYIDAMRGLTMLLVVLSHVTLFSYHGIDTTFNTAFIQFRMPLFFFISGFVLYKAERIWDSATSTTFLKNKLIVQILPTLFFLLVYDGVLGINVLYSLADSSKMGYWFTISLFEYFVLYVVMMVCCTKFNKAAWAIISMVLLLTAIADVVSYRIMPSWLCGLAGTAQLRYFPFFFMGTFVKKHFTQFCKITDSGIFMAIAVLTFLFLVLFMSGIMSLVGAIHPIANSLAYRILFFLNGALGVIVVFTFFRNKEAVFTKETFVGRSLQYIGRRTLDVYLLHYFFLPRNLSVIGDFFNQNVNPSLEFFITFAISILVVSLALCMSNILRLSSLMEHYLFGVKMHQSAHHTPAESPATSRGRGD